MMKFPIALQLYSVREQMEQSVEETLKQVKALGYDGVEFAGLFDKTPEEMRALCEKNDLIPLSAHVPFVDMMAQPEKLMEDYAKIGCQFIVIPYLTEEYRPGAAGFDQVVEGAKVLGACAKKHGMSLLYHNHDFEFDKIGDDYALDILYREVPADLLETELDTCWVKVAGEDPADYIRKYGGRARVVHLKDFQGQKSEHMYALIGIEEQGVQEESRFAFRHVGGGVQDFKSILRACEDAGTQWVVVEQDEPTEGLSRMECARLSMEYLKSL